MSFMSHVTHIRNESCHFYVRHATLSVLCKMTEMKESTSHVSHRNDMTHESCHTHLNASRHTKLSFRLNNLNARWGAGVETQKYVRGEIGGWGRVPFNETYAPSLSTIYDGA